MRRSTRPSRTASQRPCSSESSSQPVVGGTFVRSSRTAGRRSSRSASSVAASRSSSSSADWRWRAPRARRSSRRPSSSGWRSSPYRCCDERLGLAPIAALATLFVGQALVLPPDGIRWGTGETLILAATLLWGVETVLVKRLLVDVPAGTMAALRMGIGFVVLVAYLGITGRLPIVAGLAPVQWGWVVVTGFVLAAYVATWFGALRSRAGFGGDQRTRPRCGRDRRAHLGDEGHRPRCPVSSPATS